MEAAGDVDTLLLDKTGTITFGNRMATEVIPAPGVRPDIALKAALMASLRPRCSGKYFGVQLPKWSVKSLPPTPDRTERRAPAELAHSRSRR